MPNNLPQQPIDHPRLFAKKYKLSRPIPSNNGIELWYGESAGQAHWVYYFPLETPEAHKAWANWQTKWQQIRAAQGPKSLAIALEGQIELDKGVLAFQAPLGQAIDKEEKTFSELELALLLLDMSQALVALSEQNASMTIVPSMIYRRPEGGFLLHAWGLEEVYDLAMAPQKWVEDAYKAPELFDQSSVSGLQSSIFSLGVSLYQLASGKLAYGPKGGENLSPHSQGLAPLAQYSDRFNHILGLMMAYKADRRPSADTLFRLASTFIKEQHWKSVGGLSFGPNLSGTPLTKESTPKPNKRSPQEQKEKPKAPKVEETTSKSRINLWVGIIAILGMTLGFGLWWNSGEEEEAVSAVVESPVVMHLDDLESLFTARNQFADLIQNMEDKPNLPPTEKTFLRLAQMQLANLDTDLDKKLLHENGNIRAWREAPDRNWLQQIRTQLDRNIQNLEYLR